jgi:hypothetical protein
VVAAASPSASASAAPAASSAPAVGPASAPPRAGFAGRDAQILARAGSTTLGSSASELVAATEHVARPRPPLRARGALIGAATAFAAGLVVVVALRSGSRSGATPAAAPAPVVAPPPIAPPAEAVVASPSPAAVAPVATAPANVAPPPSPAARPVRHRHARAKSSGEFKAIED